MKKIFFVLGIFVLIMPLLGMQQQKKDLFTNYWEIHYSSAVPNSPFLFYRSFKFNQDGKIYTKKNEVIGRWENTLNGINVFIGVKGLHGSIVYIEKSTVMGGCGEINKFPWNIDLLLIKRSAILPKCHRGSK